jgi:hypothetical protein
MILEPVIRITSNGAQRATGDLDSGAAVRITQLEQIDIPVFDPASYLDRYFPGIVPQRSLTLAIEQWLIDHDGVISDADVPTILAMSNANLAAEVFPPYVPTTQPPYAGLPPYPAGLPRFPDFAAPDGWSIVDNGMVVRGGGP